MNYVKITIILLITLTTPSFGVSNEAAGDSTTDYKPVSSKLFNIIMKMDSIFFQAYNNCDLQKQAEIYSDDIEFYHDQGGLIASKNDILEATKNNICDKITRTLIKESLEVYPINNYGAVETGFHSFKIKGQGEGILPKPSKFIIIWHQENNEWKITRVISIH